MVFEGDDVVPALVFGDSPLHLLADTGEVFDDNLPQLQQYLFPGGFLLFYIAFDSLVHPDTSIAAKAYWGDMVPGVGLEPTRIAPADFKSAASASSATPASCYFTPLV